MHDPSGSHPSTIHARLTRSRIAKVNNPGGSTDLFMRDAILPGFGVRVTPNNVKSYFVEATIRGRFVRRVIGRFPLIPVEQARQTAIEALQQLRDGAGTSLAPQSPEVLLADLVGSFLADKERVLRPATLTDYRLVLLGDYFEPWMSAPVKKIIRRGVLDRYRHLSQQNGVGMANKAYRVLSAVINYGRAVYPSLEDWPNPIRALAEARTRTPLRPRMSHIPVECLAAWLAALDQFKEQPGTNAQRSRRSDIWLLLHLILMTGLRSNEARSLTWQDVNLTNRTILIRETVSKNHREAILPLNAWLVESLRFRQRCDDRVFPSKQRDGYVGNLRRPLDELNRLSGIRITPHDLRRSFATYLDTVGAPFGAIKQLLNHITNVDVTATYIQSRPLEQLRQYSEAVFNLIDSSVSRARARERPMPVVPGRHAKA